MSLLFIIQHSPAWIRAPHRTLHIWDQQPKGTSNTSPSLHMISGLKPQHLSLAHCSSSKLLTFRVAQVPEGKSRACFSVQMLLLQISVVNYQRHRLRKRYFSVKQQPVKQPTDSDCWAWAFSADPTPKGVPWGKKAASGKHSSAARNVCNHTGFHCTFRISVR